MKDNPLCCSYLCVCVIWYSVIIKSLNLSLLMPYFSIEFDQDDELFATAGVSRRIKVFDFSSVGYYSPNLVMQCL